MSCNSTADHSSFFGYWEVIKVEKLCKESTSKSFLPDHRIVGLEPFREPRPQWNKVSSRRVRRHHMVQRFILDSGCVREWWPAIVAHYLAIEVDGGWWEIKVHDGKWIGWHFFQLRNIWGHQHGHRHDKRARLTFSFVHGTSHRV